ncbi:phage tail domain-containing protein [Arthrobacter sp. lap29]|uniref:phage tail domain-containing protein n=1 Tax=Arthrobacter sp. lap29 TaxID=3056122 RepID=UPI0028F6E989|nr:phage tail domain-containing protein [Arthrobacter sp. lap29]
MSVNFAYGAPYAPPIPDVFIPWQGIKHTWTGWDGSIWPISDPRSGAALLADGLEGLGMPDILNYTHDSPVVHGSEWDGWLATGRKVYWHFIIYSGSAADDQPSTKAWLARHKAFWKTMRPGTTGVWTVELPTGEKFSLRLRFVSDGGHSYATDPAKRGWEAYGIELFPEQPFWEGVSVVRSWDVGEQVDFFGPTGFGPDFFISSSAQLSTATVTNPGDVDTFVTWTINGPSTTAVVGIGEDTTTVPFPIAAGSRLVIDTDPRRLTAELDGVDVMEQLTEFNYPALPPGEDVQLNLALDGTGSVEAKFPTYYLMGV